MATPVIERLSQAIRNGDRERAVFLCGDLRGERILLHDFFADCTTALFTWVGENLGEENLFEMFMFCFEQSAERQILDVMEGDVKRGIEATLLARSSWVAHSCAGAGEHGGSFLMVEDDEKFTFRMDPCGSGGRLWRKGRYEPPIGFGTTSRAYPWAYNREGLPYYCVHCAFLNELLPYRRLGFLSWPVDPPEGPDDVCRWHLYKDRYGVPATYYTRSGLEPPKRQGKPVSVERWFTDEQLEEMVMHTPDRIEAALRSGDLKKARGICKKMAGEFFFLHSLYVNMVVSVLDFIAREAGEESLGRVISYIYEKCLKGQVAGLLGGLPRREATRAIIGDFFLADTSGGAGFPPPRLKITEDDRSIRVELSPCGSGGKLRKRNAYESQGRVAKARERLENAVIKVSVSLPLPRGLIEFTMPIVMGYISETRRPHGMGVTRQGYDWSGGREGLPYYCCLCTGLLTESGADWLEVTPPTDQSSPCVWQARK
jgi:hypothetical protein